MTGVLVTLAALVLLAVPAVLLPSVLRVRGRAFWLIAALLIAAADVVGCFLVLSPFDAVTRTGLLVALTVVAAGSAAAWGFSGRPAPPRMTTGPAWRALAGAPLAMVAVAVVALAVELFLVSVVAPGNWDSMTYHLSRAAYWLQYGSVGYFPGGTIRQLASAPNGEILQAFTMLTTGTDRWVESIQWLSLVGLAATIFAGARLIGFERGPAAFAAAVFVVLPQPVLQATTTQNDLIVAFFLTATALFAVRGLRDRHLGDLTIAAIALGLAVGTKGTALLMGPALALIVIAAVIGYRPGRRTVLTGAGLAIAGVVALGAYSYGLNVVETGDAFGGLEEQVSGGAADRSPAANAVQDLWTFVDAPGMNAGWLDPLVTRGGKRLFGSLVGWDFPFNVDTSVQEDTSGFGLVGFLVLPVILLVALLGRRSPLAWRILAGATLLFLAVFALRLDYNPWMARLMVPGVALAAPLLALAARRSWVAGAVGTLAVLSLVPSLLQNVQKPLLVPIGEQNVVQWDHIAQQTFIRPEQGSVLRKLAETVDSDEPIVFVGEEDSWDYPLFGSNRQRRVIRIDPDELTQARLRREGVAGAVFANLGAPPAGLKAVELAPDVYWIPARPSAG